MDLGQQLGRRQSDASFLSRTFGNRIRSNTTSLESDQEVVGLTGLNTLHTPILETRVEIIFIHGLRGGSRQAWSYSPNLAHFWPQEWLPHHPDFQHARIHSYGYNSDWMLRRENPLSIHDFGRNFIEAIHSSPELRRDASTRIILVAHSMGGLVTKKAVILADHDPNFKDVRNRIHAIFFFGTPHRGADLATMLSKYLKATGTSSKHYVTDLMRGSELTNVLTDQFRHVYQGIELFSFYETVPMNWTVGSGLIVERDSAIMGLPGEHTISIESDHRFMNKYLSPQDAEYRKVVDCLRGAVQDAVNKVPAIKSQKHLDDLRALSNYLNISYLPDDELSNIEDDRLENSCEWFIQHKDFQNWVADLTPERYLWLKGPPGSGKSFITASAIGQINPRQCSFFFFKGDHESKINSLLQSIAYQMALNDHGVRETLLSIQRDGLQLPKDDHRSVWRKLFVNGIFQQWPNSTQYWIIDALDECRDTGKKLQQNLQSIFSSIDKSLPLKIFISSRPTSDVEQLIHHLPHKAIEVTQDATSRDIRQYVEAYSDTLPDETEEEKRALVEKIIQKSSGFFLWVRVIVKLLEDCYSAEQIREVIEEVPEELEDLYYKNLETISAKSQGSRSRHTASITRLAKTIFTWTVCATKPLTLEELKHAIKLDIDDDIRRDLRSSIGSLCGHLVYVDKKGLVQMTHQTAKDFLTRPDLDSEFRIDVAQGHLELATACLKLLCSDEMKHVRRNRASSYGQPVQSGPLASYACQSFAEHLFRSTSIDNQLFSLLMTFLKTNVLTWIERQAICKDLNQLIRASAHFKAYMRRRSKHLPALQDDVSLWARDLPRIVTEFGGNLLDCPHAIHYLIPPLCPKNSIIYIRFAGELSGLRLQGLTHVDWFDCISSTISKNSPANCLICHDQWYAVGLADGTICLYDTSTCASLMTLDHGDSVRMLAVGSNNKILGSADLYTVKIWDLESRSQLFQVKLDKTPLSIVLDENTSVVVIATRGSEVLRYSFRSKQRLSRKGLKNILDVQSSEAYERVPIGMELSTDSKLAAVAYRSKPLLVYDYETGQPLHKFSAESNAEDTSWNITSVAFNPNNEFHALAVAYWDGTIAIFDTETQSAVRQVKAASQTLAISPDGRTLAGGNTSGQIQLFDFATLDLLYTIAPSQHGVTAMAFTADSRRLIDVRAHQINVWEPSVLTRTTIDDTQSEPSDAASRAVEETQVSAETEYISSIVECYHGSRVICGKSNGVVQMYDMTTESKLSWSLYKHKGGPAHVSVLDWNQKSQLIASGDVSGRFQVVQLDGTAQPRTKPTRLLYQGQLEYGANVESILIDPPGTKVLIASSMVEEIWCLRTRKLVKRLRRASQAKCKWFNHPSKPTQMIRFQGKAVQVYSWEGFEPQSQLISVQDRSGPLSKVKVSSSILHHQNGRMKLLFLVRQNSSGSKKPGGAPKAELYATDLSHLDQHTTEVISYPIFGNAAHSKAVPNIDLLIGTVPNVFGSQWIVFMSENGWLCSFDVADGFAQDSFRRHFLIPFVWRSAQNRLLAKATHNREMLFVQSDEIAVARNGFDEVDIVQLE